MWELLLLIDKQASQVHCQAFVSLPAPNDQNPQQDPIIIIRRRHFKHPTTLCVNQI
jgi:hypothetical protein